MYMSMMVIVVLIIKMVIVVLCFVNSDVSGGSIVMFSKLDEIRMVLKICFMFSGSIV